MPHYVRTHTAHQSLREDRSRKRARKRAHFEWTTKAPSIRSFPPGQKQDIASRNDARVVHSIIWLLDCGPLLGGKAAPSFTYPLCHLLRLARFTGLQLLSYFTERSDFIALCRCLALVYADASPSSRESGRFSDADACECTRCERNGRLTVVRVASNCHSALGRQAGVEGSSTTVLWARCERY